MKIRTMTRVALFAALTAVGAFIRIPLGYSSITLQTFFTAMAGCVLGPWYGALSQLVYVALGLVGLPIFTQGGGIGYLMQPTCGFLIGLIPAAWVIGRIAGRKPEPKQIVPACQNRADQTVQPRAAAPLLIGQATAPRHNAFHIIQQRRGGLRHVIKHRAALEMKLEAAVVHVHRADEARLPVGEGGLTVQQPRLEGVDPHAAL